MEKEFGLGWQVTPEMAEEMELYWDELERRAEEALENGTLWD